MTDKAATHRANEALGALAVLCAPEIAHAFNEFKGSSSVLISDPELFVREATEVGVRKAAQTLRDEPGRLLLDHVKDCVTSVLKDAEADQREELRNLASDQLPDIILGLARSDAASFLSYASFDQCSGLVVELVRRLAFSSPVDSATKGIVALTETGIQSYEQRGHNLSTAVKTRKVSFLEMTQASHCFTKATTVRPMGLATRGQQAALSVNQSADYCQISVK